MKSIRGDEAAGGGLLKRRSFLSLTTGVGAAGVLSAWPAGAQEGFEALPVWMRTLGGPEAPYGAPSKYEQHVQRVRGKVLPQNAGFAIWHSPLETQRGIITPSGLHFVINHNGSPDVNPEQHRLLIHGMVDRPLSFDVESLLRYPMTTGIHFLECSGNTAANALSPTARDDDCTALFGQVSGSEWCGVPLSVLLREAGVKPKAKWVIAEGADGGSHARSIPLAKVLDDAVVALYQNGERLRPSQGYPMRLFLPGWEGNACVKWLHRLEVTDAPAYTKDESGVYSEVLSDRDIQRFSFHMDVKSVITHPSGRQQLPEPGLYEVSGLAWSGLGTIAEVQVSADGGKTWARASLSQPVLDKSLTRFTIPWQWDGQRTALLSRAVDSTGRVQPTRASWKARYAAHSFNHYNAVQAWEVRADGRVANVYV